MAEPDVILQPSLVTEVCKPSAKMGGAVVIYGHRSQIKVDLKRSP